MHNVYRGIKHFLEVKKKHTLNCNEIDIFCAFTTYSNILITIVITTILMTIRIISITTIVIVVVRVIADEEN